ncbi:MAG: hypothetical protein WAM54_06560 [Nitrososphaeraceae archaeon]
MQGLRYDKYDKSRKWGTQKTRIIIILIGLILSFNQRMNKKIALNLAAVFVSTILVGIGSITSVVYAQVEEQEGNLAGKVAKLQVVIDTCDQKIRDGGPVWEGVKNDCFKVVDSFNLVMSEALKNNSVSIENILYGK